LRVERNGDQHVFDVQVYLAELDREAVRIELYAEPREGGDPICQMMTRGDPLIGAENAYHYVAQILANRPASHFTPRIVPYHEGAIIPLEAAQILWYR
jgi:starch phosphorylase